MYKNIDVRVLRQKLGMTQREFTVFGCSESSIRAWEAGKTKPRAYTQNLLKVIHAHPQMVLDVARKIVKPARTQSSYRG